MDDLEAMSLVYIIAHNEIDCGFELPYTANLSRGKTFTVIAVLKPSAKVFQRSY